MFQTVSDVQNSGDSVVKKAAPRKRASRAKNVKAAVGKAAVATAKVTTDVEMTVNLISDDVEGTADETIANSTGELTADEEIATGEATDIPIDQNEKSDEKLDAGISVNSPMEAAITSSSAQAKSTDMGITVDLTSNENAVTLATSIEASTDVTTLPTVSATTDTPTVPVVAVLPITGVKRSRVVAVKVAYIYIIHEISTSRVNYVRRILPYICSIYIQMHIYFLSGGSCDSQRERSRLVT